MGMISPTPTDLSQNKILDLLQPCTRYVQTSSDSSMKVNSSSNYLGVHEFKDTTNPTYFAPTFNQEAFHDVEFTFQSPEEEKHDPLKQRIYGHRMILSVRCPYFKQMFTSGMGEARRWRFQSPM